LNVFLPKVRIIAGFAVLLALNSSFSVAGESEMTSAGLIKTADSIFASGNHEKSRELFIMALDTAQKEGNVSNAVEANAMIARCYHIAGNLEAGLAYLKAAQDEVRIEMPSGWSRYLGVKGRFEWKQNDLIKATETFMEMYEYCRENRLSERAIDATHMVAITGTAEQQIEWGKKGIEEAATNNITSWLGPLWNNLAATYEDQKRYPEALEAYLQAREYHWRQGTEQNKLIADWAVGHAYLLNGNYDMAGQWLRPVLAWAERIDNSEFAGYAYRDLGEISLKAGDKKRALEYYIKAEECLKQAGMPDWDADGYKKLVDRIKEVESDLE
jgi:tetratricopeptide (TPR) repeat protein